jgi:uncharacterized damage-inducible protein DinB
METKRIASQLRRSYEGEAWHGPSLRELLEDVTAERAAAKPLAGTHSIWELVLHVDAWERAALAVVGGSRFDVLAGDADWPPLRETSAEAWQGALDRLESTTRELVAVIRAMDDARLEELAGGREFNLYFLLHGVVQHNLYHAGQIALLKKAG